MRSLPNPPGGFKPPKIITSQVHRAVAIAFSRDLAAGRVAGAPAGSRLETSDLHGAEIVVPHGGRRPVSSWWGRAVLMGWLDRPAACPLERAMQLVNPDAQVNRKLVEGVVDWLVAEVWTAATPPVKTEGN